MNIARQKDQNIFVASSHPAGLSRGALHTPFSDIDPKSCPRASKGFTNRGAVSTTDNTRDSVGRKAGCDLMNAPRALPPSPPGEKLCLKVEAMR